MKLNTTTLVLGVALAVAAGLFGSTIFGMTGTESNAQTSTSATGLMTGHVTTTVTDADGNVKAYRQSDNIIVQAGENCTVAKLFGTIPDVCTEGSAVYTVIAIGNGTTTNVPRNSTSLSFDWPANGGTPAEHNVAGLVRDTATTITPEAATQTAFAKVLLAYTFENTSGATRDVTQSGLFNSTTIDAPGMFARQNFSTISMNDGDSLTVQWTINIGGQTALENPGPA